VQGSHLFAGGGIVPGPQGFGCPEQAVRVVSAPCDVGLEIRQVGAFGIGCLEFLKKSFHPNDVSLCEGLHGFKLASIDNDGIEGDEFPGKRQWEWLG